MDKLIKEMQEKGLVTVRKFRLSGHMPYVKEMLNIMCHTESEESNQEWWQLRLWTRRN